jgi:hypothetical protein
MKNVQQKRCHDFASNHEPKQMGKKAATQKNTSPCVPTPNIHHPRPNSQESTDLRGSNASISKIIPSIHQTLPYVSVQLPPIILSPHSNVINTT